MYDDTCRFLAEHFSADFASWLLGKPVEMTELKPSELSLDPIRADAMIRPPAKVKNKSFSILFPSKRPPNP